MATKVITPTTAEPVTLQEAKSHLRIDFTDDDSYILGLISAARGYAEGIQKRSIGVQTLELNLDEFPVTSSRTYGYFYGYGMGKAGIYGSGAIQLHSGPVQSVVSVKYTQSDGSAVTMVEGTDYLLNSRDQVVPVSTWPVVNLISADAIKIQYTAGYNICPPATKQAILLMVGHFYENREAVVVTSSRSGASELPLAVQSLLALDRDW